MIHFECPSLSIVCPSFFRMFLALSAWYARVAAERTRPTVLGATCESMYVVPTHELEKCRADEFFLLVCHSVEKRQKNASLKSDRV